MHALDPPLAVREMYLYLNRRHHALLPLLAGHLREMKDDGTFAALKEESLGPFLQGKACVEAGN